VTLLSSQMPINILLYAGDLVLLTPHGGQRLLNICISVVVELYMNFMHNENGIHCGTRFKRTNLLQIHNSRLA